MLRSGAHGLSQGYWRVTAGLAEAGTRALETCSVVSWPRVPGAAVSSGGALGRSGAMSGRRTWSQTRVQKTANRTVAGEGVPVAGGFPGDEPVAGQLGEAIAGLVHAVGPVQQAGLQAAEGPAGDAGDREQHGGDGAGQGLAPNRSAGAFLPSPVSAGLVIGSMTGLTSTVSWPAVSVCSRRALTARALSCSSGRFSSLRLTRRSLGLLIRSRSAVRSRP